jgi:hypothetical protein
MEGQSIMTTLMEQLTAEIRAVEERAREAEFRADQAEYELYTRAKYSADDKKDLLAQGKAIKNANGDPSYPINDLDDLGKAIKAVGRGAADHDKIRKHIIKQAKSLSAEDQVPDTWNADGSLKASTQSNSLVGDSETRDDTDTKTCPTCDGKGTILMGNRKCPDCGGDGKVPSDFEAKSAYIPVITWVDQYTSDLTRNIKHEPDYRNGPDDIEDRQSAKTVRALLADLNKLPEEERESAISSAPNPDEIRDALTSYNDIENAVEDALQDKLGDDDGDCDLWVCDGGDGWAIFTSYVNPPGMGTFKVTYDMEDDGTITFTSEPVPVARVTTYEEIPQAKPTLTGTAVEAKRSLQLIELERERDELNRSA